MSLRFCSASAADKNGPVGRLVMALQTPASPSM